MNNLKKLHEPANGALKAIGFMSGSGTNLCRILEHEKRLIKEKGISPFNICAIFTDTYNSKAAEIGKEYNLPVITRDIRAFYKVYGKPRSDLSIRALFDQETVKVLTPFGATAAVYAGYMSITTEVLYNAFLGINVHPADLSVMENGVRKWRGHNVVQDALIAGEQVLHSSTHILEKEVDGGRILMISPPIPVKQLPGIDITNKVDLKTLTSVNQDQVKEQGDWIILPLTIQYIAEGRFSADENGNLYFDDNPIPYGYKLE